MVAGALSVRGKQGFEISIEAGKDGCASAEEAECDFSKAVLVSLVFRGTRCA